jgi:hypothetical protein
MTDEERRQQRREAGLKGAQTKSKERLREIAIKAAGTPEQQKRRQTLWHNSCFS